MNYWLLFFVSLLNSVGISFLLNEIFFLFFYIYQIEKFTSEYGHDNGGGLGLVLGLLLLKVISLVVVSIVLTALLVFLLRKNKSFYIKHKVKFLFSGLSLFGAALVIYLKGGALIIYSNYFR